MNRSELQQAILNAMTQHAAYTDRLSSSVVNDILRQFDKISSENLKDLQALLDNLTSSELTALSGARYTTPSLKQVKSSIDEWMTQVNGLSQMFVESSISLAAYEAAYIYQLADRKAPAISGESLYNKFKDKPYAGGKLFKKIFPSITEELRERVQAILSDGIDNSQTNAQIIQRIRGTKTSDFKDGMLHISRNHIDAEVRTARAKVSSEAYSDTWTELGFKYVKDIGTLDFRTTNLCASIDGRVQKLNKKTKKPPYHYRCLVGDTNILPVGAISGYSKRWFDGEITIIKTAKGRVLRSTPNHPVLSSFGWIGSGSLNVGDNIVSDLTGDWVSCGIGNHKDVPPLIKHVVDSLLRSSNMISMPVPISPEDFHGDGEGSKVAIVSSDSFLLNNVGNPSIIKHVEQENLPSSNRGLCDVSLSCLSSCKSLGIGVGSGCCSDVGFSYNGFSFFKSCFSHSSKLLFRPISSAYSMFFENCFCGSGADGELLNKVLLKSISNLASGEVSSNDNCDYIYSATQGFGDISLRDSAIIEIDNILNKFFSGSKSNYTDLVAFFSQNSIDDTSINSELISYLIDRNPYIIGLDKVVSVETEIFSGHVYNLETENGLYIANGIITHNCRTVQIGCNKDGELEGVRPYVSADKPVSEIPKNERKGLIGQVNANKTYADWFAEQTPEHQKLWLGWTRYKLYKDGGYTIDRFLDPLSGRRYNLAALREMDMETFRALGLRQF